MSSSLGFSFIERFRHWYEYERDCNRKVVQMLRSVPEGERASASFSRALGKAAHLVAARQMWLYRLGAGTDRPEKSFPQTALDELPAAFEKVERGWVAYLGRLSDDELLAEFSWTGWDGKRYRWPLVDLLTQVFGHAWYHRGQIAMLVKDLGGEPVDTDFIFWDRPTVVSG